MTHTVTAIAAAFTLRAIAAHGTVAPPTTPPRGHAVFVDVTSEVGLDWRHDNGMTGKRFFVEMMGPGGAMADLDGDGDLDLYLRQGGPLDSDTTTSQSLRDGIYRNDLQTAPGLPPLRLVSRTTQGTGASGDYGMGIAAGDVDNDGDVDLYLTNFGPNRLLLNLGDGTFADATMSSGAQDNGWSTAATMADFNGDGWTDLFVGNYLDFSTAMHRPCRRPTGALDYCAPTNYEPLPDRLFRNSGAGRFTDVTAQSGMATAVGATLSSLALDVDRDSRLDLVVANDAMENFLWLQDASGRFRQEGLIRGIAVNAAGEVEGSMGLAAGDFDRDADEDLFLTHMATETHTLYVDLGGGDYLDRTLTLGLAAPSLWATGFGTHWLDFDRDGRLDLLAVNGAVRVIEEQEVAGDELPLRQTNQLFRNVDGQRFEALSLPDSSPSIDGEVSRGAAFGDLDNDGDTDVLILNNNGPARLLLGSSADSTSWLSFRARGEHGYDAIGARLEVTYEAGRITAHTIRTDGSYLSANDPRVLTHWGAGHAATSVRVEWPSGPKQLYRLNAAGRALMFVQPQRPGK